jgi:hypothetical protein
MKRDEDCTICIMDVGNCIVALLCCIYHGKGVSLGENIQTDRKVVELFARDHLAQIEKRQAVLCRNSIWI